MIRVTTVDEETGDTGTAELKPDSYVLVLGERLYRDAEVVYKNGTRMITIKRKPASTPDGS